jgi:hypothetical protein
MDVLFPHETRSLDLSMGPKVPTDKYLQQLLSNLLTRLFLREIRSISIQTFFQTKNKW